MAEWDVVEQSPAARVDDAWSVVTQQPAAAPVSDPWVVQSQVPVAAAPAPQAPAQPGFFDKLLGLNGAQRYQTWPERLARGAIGTPHEAMTGQLGEPGSREFSERAVPGALDMSAAAILGGPPRVGPKGTAQAPGNIEVRPTPPEMRAAPQTIVDTVGRTAPEGSRTRVTINGETAQTPASGNVVSLAERQSATQFLRDLGHTPEVDPAYFADPVKWAEAAGWSRDPSISKTMQTQQALSDMGANPREFVYQRPNAANANGFARVEPPVEPQPAQTAPTATPAGMPPAPEPPGVFRRIAQGTEKVFSPETVDANADAAVATIRAATGKAARDTATTNAALEPYHARVNSLPPERQLDFINYVEGRGRGEAPIGQFKRDMGVLERTVPSVPDGMTRLWRGNRPGEVGTATTFTNDAPGIAMPFKKGYGGDLSYVDVPTARLKEFEQTSTVARGAEFNLPPELARGARSVPYEIGVGGGRIPKELQPIADELKTAFEQRRAKIEELPEHEGMSFVDDYFPHFWKDPNAATAFVNQYRGGASKLGSGASLKARTVPTMAEGIEKGLVPVTTNPIDAALRYVQSMDLFIADAQIRNAGKEQGLIRYIRPQTMGASGHPDSFKVPEGWVPLKGGRGTTDATGAQAYAPEGYARIYNNFRSRGFHDIGQAEGDAVVAGQKVSNAVTALELGLSGYHALTMMQEAMVNQLARGIGNLRSGKPIEAAKDVVGTPLAPITRAVQGNRLRDVYLGKSEGTPEARQIADLLEAGGGRAAGFRHSPDYEFSGAGSYWTAFKRGALKSQLIGDMKDIQGRPLNGTLAAGARHVGRIMDTVAQPIFEKYIPAIKNGAFYENMSAWLEQNPAAPHEQQVRAARQILDSIDNRFGEMVQDNVFWNKALKQVAMLSLRSWSWTVGGSFREIGGGIRDTLRAPFKSVNAENLGPNDKRWTQKMDYVIALPVVYGALSAAYQYMKTGEAPADMRDLMAPRTGGVDANSGEPERLLIPGYMKDVYGFAEHPVQEMKYKFATAPTKALELLNNKNWRGDPIASPKDWGGPERGWLGEQESAIAHAPQWLKDYWKYTTESFGPISLRNVMRGQKEGSNLNPMESALGVRTAPRQFMDPEGYEKMMQGIGKRDWQKKLRFEAREKQRYGGTD